MPADHEPPTAPGPSTWPGTPQPAPSEAAEDFDDSTRVVGPGALGPRTGSYSSRGKPSANQTLSRAAPLATMGR